MQSRKGFVVYAGPFAFPEGGAAARRIYANCKTIQNIGYDVIVLSGQMSNQVLIDYQGIKVVSLNERLFENLPRYLKHFMYFSAGKKAIDWLNAQEEKPQAVIVYSGYSPYLLRLIPWCRKNSVKIIFDTVEWYDAINPIAQYLIPYYINIEFAMRFLIKRCDGLIVISSYLRDYYSRHLEKLITVPPTVDCNEIKSQPISINNIETVFVYAGTPGKKDKVDLIISGLLKLHVEGFRVKLNLVGVSLSDLKKYQSLKVLDESLLNEFIVFHGYLSHSSTTKIVSDSDFSVILRPNIRSVQAGFPTKFVESLSLGTPVIANLTSDLALYLKDGINGFIVNDITIDNVVEVLKKACDCELSTKNMLRLNSIKTTLDCFDILNFEVEFKSLIDD